MTTTDGFEWRLVGTTLTASSTDRILPVINSHFYYVLNESGSGEVTIPINSAAAGVVTEGMLVVLYYRGAIRASFLVENIRKVPASSQEGAGQVLSISGLGGMTLLDRSIIWDNGTGASKRDFTAVTKASIMITLITEAQARGGLANLTYDFTAANDSAATPWTDSENYSLTVGTSLLDTLRGFAKTGIEFEMNYSGTGFVLSAYLGGIGTDVSDTIFFRTGTNCTSIDIDQRGNAIKNALLVAFRDGNISLTDGTSIATNGRREDLLDAKLAQSAASATTYGAAVLSTKKDTQIGRIIKVYDGISPYLFLNYILGDTVTLDIEGVETTDRILGIQCDFDGNEYSNVTIELNSLMLEQNLRMQQDLDWLMNQWQTAHDSNLLEVRYWANFNGAGDNATGIGAMHVVGTKLYIGGNYSKIGGLFLANGLAEYDIATGLWTAIAGSNVNYYTSCITNIGSDIYFAGYMDVYKYSGGVLTKIGVFEEAGLNGHIRAITTDGTDIFVTGLFDAETTQPIAGLAYVAKYTVATDTWSALSTGLPSYGFSIIKFGTDIVVGGGAPEATTGYLYSWNGITWTNLKSDFGGAVYALALYGSDLLVGGYFTDLLGLWDGAAFTTFGGGFGTAGDSVKAIAVYLTDVYVTGTFTDVGNYIAKYSGGVWSQLTTGLNAYGAALALYNTDLYVGGGFTTAGDKSVLGMAIYFTNFESLLNNLENDRSGFDMGAAIHNAPASAITASDEVPFWEDVSNALRKITWSNILATIKTYTDTLYLSLASMSAANALDLTDGGATTLHTHAGGGGTPGGADTQIQFNDGGAFGGDADLTWDKTNNVLNIGGTPPTAAASSLNQSASGVSVGHFLWTHGATFASYLTGVFSRGTTGSPTQSLLGDIALRLRGRWHDDSTYGNTQAEIRYVANENHTTTNHGTRVEILTTPDASTTLTKAVTIENSGNMTVVQNVEAKNIHSPFLLMGG